MYINVNVYVYDKYKHTKLFAKDQCILRLLLHNYNKNNKNDNNDKNNKDKDTSTGGGGGYVEECSLTTTRNVPYKSLSLYLPIYTNTSLFYFFLLIHMQMCPQVYVYTYISSRRRLCCWSRSTLYSQPYNILKVIEEWCLLVYIFNRLMVDLLVLDEVEDAIPLLFSLNDTLQNSRWQISEFVVQQNVVLIDDSNVCASISHIRSRYTWLYFNLDGA